MKSNDFLVHVNFNMFSVKTMHFIDYIYYCVDIFSVLVFNDNAGG